MVVDDAIVVLENVTNHIERGSAPKQAAIHGTNEVAISVIASTLTMLAVFLPLTMITGMAGILFRQLGWIVSIIMIVSTVCALSLTPMLCSQWLRLDPKKGKLFMLFFYTDRKSFGFAGYRVCKINYLGSRSSYDCRMWCCSNFCRKFVSHKIHFYRIFPDAR